jgi:ABC-2 type transport system permease protein
MLLALIPQLVHRVRRLLLASGILLAAFQIVLILQANSIQSAHSFAQVGALIPSFMRDIMGPSFVSFLTYSGMVSFGYFHPVVIGALISVSITLATIPVMEIENGFIDLILARPVARHWIVIRSILVALIAAVFLLAMMALGTWLGLKSFAPKNAVWPSARVVGLLAMNLGFLMLCWAAIAMAIGAVCRRRSSAGAIVGLLALIAYLTDYIGRAWKPADSVAWLSPFRYYAPFELVMGSPLSTRNVCVLGGIAISTFRADLGVLFAQGHFALTALLSSTSVFCSGRTR